jgi:hypothetical protein
LYTSPWFVKARRFVESQGSPWFILSAEYGLVEPAAETEPYERTLNTMSTRERREWAQRTFGQLVPHLARVRRTVVLAGMRYREFLLPRLSWLGLVVDVPLAGMRIGEQLHWFVERARAKR